MVQEATSIQSMSGDDNQLFREFLVVPGESPTCESSLEGYQIDKAIEAWDQIGSLSSEVATSLLAKQASTLCEKFKRENGDHHYWGSCKKRKVLSAEDSTKEEIANLGVVSVGSDDNSHETDASLPENFSLQIDRMARMSKIMLEIENCHRLLRDEMMAMAGESDL